MKRNTSYSKWDNGHTLRRKHLRALLFPRSPVGPFCFLKQNKHTDSSKDRRRDQRRLGHLFKLQQRNLLDA